MRTAREMRPETQLEETAAPDACEIRRATRQERRRQLVALTAEHERLELELEPFVYLTRPEPESPKIDRRHLRSVAPLGSNIVISSTARLAAFDHGN